ncbi:MAG: 4Fe-4S ferredoxin, partial [Burkholderiaceae bacterium]
MPLNEQNMGQPVFQALCRHEVGAYLTALEQPDDLLVACTQEKPLFTALAESKTDVRATALRFVNIRESACWSSQADQALPKVKALLAVAGMSDPDPVPSVSYRSHGRLLVLGPASRVTLALDILDSFEGLEATTIVTDRDALIPAGRARPAITGTVTSLQGYLGAFEVCWVQSNPIDLEVCTRCGACQT